MPEKPLTVITYAASASLAAVALVYFFNPNYLIDGETSASSSSVRKKGVVGLSNPANDCFINSVLQSLAGLGDLRLYLIRELHRRKLGGPEIYESLPKPDDNGKPIDEKKLLSLQHGEVTKGLKNIIDKLNERPLHRKTISAGGFIAVLEHAFGTRISKSQQDAQELLQVVAERLSEEYHAGRDARRRALNASTSQVRGIGRSDRDIDISKHRQVENNVLESSIPPSQDGVRELKDASETKVIPTEEEDGFPLEGEAESEIECQYCHFVPKPNKTSFVMLTLAVPQKSSATLNECFDAQFKRELIDDYKCDKCRLEHALEVFRKELLRAKTEKTKSALQTYIVKVEKSLKEDPEKPPDGVVLPDSKTAPKRKIARSVQINHFPKILVIHLSRSIYDTTSSSTKNLAKVSFPEKLPLGGLLKRRNYKLLGMVAHKGTHNSGHYETFRRQHLYPPYSTPCVRDPRSPYSATKTSQVLTPLTPELLATPSSQSEAHFEALGGPVGGEGLSPSTLASSPALSTTSVSSPSTRPSSGSVSGNGFGRKDVTSAPRPAQLQDVSEQEVSASRSCSRPTTPLSSKAAAALDPTRLRRKSRSVDRWWRISDEKIKECKTNEVLGMQKEVYMLFYEMEKD
ncbi:hypothetical protein MMC09_005961 [Bachmanniomyces sp. S44760]|nr:hypothetical protein [Bachmanniomyces sp. S44760]